MEIRWEISGPDNNRSGKHKRLVAILVDEQLETSGKADHPGRRLGSVEERFLNVNVAELRDFHKGLFWSVVDKRLDELDLDSDQRSAIEKEISEKIPRPCEEWALWGVTCIPKFER